MISALLFINLKGDIIISRYYRDNVSRSAAETFRTQVIGAKRTGVPIIYLDKCSFLYLRVGDVYLVAVTKHNANPTLVFQFMDKMIDVFRAYFGGAFNEENCRQNFVLIYELLDECCDYGYPQITATNILTSYIQVAALKSGANDHLQSSLSTSDAGLTSEITGNVDWRQAGKFKYRKNEVFIDVLEAVNLLMSTKGVVLRADVSGKIMMKTYLSGMPECFAEDQQLLTEKGFQGIDDMLAQADQSGHLPTVATFNPHSKQIEYRPATTLFTKMGTHTMVDVGEQVMWGMEGKPEGSSGVSLSVTADHDLYARVGSRQMKRGGEGSMEWQHASFEKMSAENLISRDANQHVQLQAHATHGAAPSPLAALDFRSALQLTNQEQQAAFLELYGYFLAHGSMLRRATGAQEDALQLHSTPSQEPRYLPSLLSRLSLRQGVDYSLHLHDGRKQVQIHNSRWTHYFSQHLSSEHPSMAVWVWQLNQAQAAALLQGVRMASGEGSNFEGAIYTESTTLREQLVRLCLHAGYSAHFTQLQGGRWCVSYSASAQSTTPLLSSSQSVRTRTFTGRVWCVSVPPHHLVIVRRAEMSPLGSVLRASRPVVVGQCKLGMNDKLVMEKERGGAVRPKTSSGIVIDDVTFHRCVKLGQFEVDRSINFIPPDGEFELMKYRITDNVNLPFRVLPIITEHGRSRVEYEIKIKGNFSNKLFASHVLVRIPTPPNVSKVTLHPGLGKAKYNASQNCILWKMHKFPGDAAYVLRGECKMLVGMEDKVWSKPPLTMEFQVPMFTASGLHVRFMKVFERSNYETIKWIRYATQAGTYQIRL